MSLDDEHLENYSVAKGEEWINLEIKTINGDSYDLGKTYLSESIDSITEKAKKEIGLFGNLSVALIFCGKPLNKEKTLKDYNFSLEFICNDNYYVAFLIAIRLKGGGGSMGLPFIDVESSEIKKLEFREAPEYRRVIRGLNFLGKCKNKKCRIKGEFFYIKIGKGTFDYFKLMEDDKFVCPICDYPIIPDTCGFWNCKFQIKGEGKGKEIKTFSRSGVAGEDFFYLFNPAGEHKDKVIYCSLVFTVS